MPSSPDSRGPSRRDFLKGASAGAAAGTVLIRSSARAEEPSQAALVRGLTTCRLTVNGQPLEVQVEPRTTLLDALREGRTRDGVADLTGTKRVCDRGTCGACTVHLDGKPVYGCSVLALDAVGREIRTVEGLGTPDALHVIQDEFINHDGLMCGFCTPGFVMASAALLERNPNPTRDQIKQALDGNICRCGTYACVFDAVEAAAARLRQGG